MYGLFSLSIAGYGSAKIIEIDQELTELQSDFLRCHFLWITSIV